MTRRTPKSFPTRLVAIASLGAWLAVAGACRSVPAPQPAVSREAEACLERGLDRLFLVQNGAFDESSSAPDDIARAAELAPDWWPIERALQDDLRQRDGALESYRLALERLAARPHSARDAYLCARMEGASGLALFERARELAPESFWPLHGLAQLAYDRGDAARANDLERAALERARSDFERALGWETLIASTELAAGLDAALDACKQAQGRLADALPAQRARIEARRAALLLRSEGALAREQGWRSARDLLIGERIAARDVPALFNAAWSAHAYTPERASALRLIHARWPASLRGALRLPSDAPRDARRAARERAFDALRPVRALEAYLAELPDAPRAACVDGAAALAAARRFEAEAARTESAERRAAAQDLSIALLRLGWHAEALRFALALQSEWPDGAAAFEQRARGALAIDADARAAYERLDDDYFGDLLARAGASSSRASDARGSSRGGARGVEDVLNSLSDAARAWWPALQIESSVPAVSRSPLLSFEPLGALVHPGPWYDELDERAGRGVDASAVDGLARLAANVGRFALLGHALGVGVDGCWMRRIGIELCSGEQFGVAWSGTVAWCDGAVAGIRPARLGSAIAGLAIHQGYWIDLEILRDEAQRLARIEAPQALARALRTEARRVLPARGLYARTRAAASTDALDAAAPWLAEGLRVRLALLGERLAQGGDAPLVTFGEIVDATTTHERAHLCDRTRLWPPWSHPLAVLRFFLRAGVSSSAIQRRLEYRAELSALCLVPEPRLVLASLLDLAEGRGAAPTEHARAYDALGRDLVHELERALARDPAAWPEIDSNLELQWQLHRLRPERVRTLALALARSEGLRDG